MPYVREGKCVYKKNKDGSKGEKKGCSESVEEAKAYMRKLYQVESEKSVLAEMNMFIHKASREKKDGVMRLFMVNSDTGEDVFGEKMSLELFQDFVERSDNNVPVPEPFDKIIEKTEKGWWMGGPPYLSIAHYKSGAGKNVPGKQEKLYIDGEKLKSVDILDDTPLGNRVWNSVYTDLYEEDSSYENPVRVSIGFLDLEHKHEGANENDSDFVFTRTGLKDKCELCEEGVGNKVYLKGHLVHKAFTRVPANERTLVEVDDMTEKSGIVNKKDDARSIIDDLADELEEKAIYDDILVTKAEEKDYREYANKVERAFSEAFAPAPQPVLYVRSVKDKSVTVVEYDPETYAEDKIYKIGYSEKDGKFSFDKRSTWEEMQYGLMPKKSEADDSEWEVKFKNEPQPEKSVAEDNSEAKMGEETKVQETPVVEEEQAKEEEVKEPEKEVVAEVTVSQAEKAVQGLFDKVAELKANGKYGQTALQEIQPMFNRVGEVVKNELSAPGGYIDEDALATKVAEKLMPNIADMIAKSLASVGAVPQGQADAVNNFVSRSLAPTSPQLNAEQGKELTQIQKIANRSTGLQ